MAVEVARLLRRIMAHSYRPGERLDSQMKEVHQEQQVAKQAWSYDIKKFKKAKKGTLTLYRKRSKRAIASKLGSIIVRS